MTAPDNGPTRPRWMRTMMDWFAVYASVVMGGGILLGALTKNGTLTLICTFCLILLAYAAARRAGDGR